MFRLKVITKQHPTEDSKKVGIALKSILQGEVKKENIGEDIYLYIESTNPRDLDQFYDLLRQQRILDVARKTLRNSIVENATYFYLNKQVAFIGKINFCEEEGESPLGPIRVEIEYDNINHLIDWLTPFTKNGSEITLVDKFP